MGVGCVSVGGRGGEKVGKSPIFLLACHSRKLFQICPRFVSTLIKIIFSGGSALMQWSDWSPCFGRCSVKFQARNCSKGCVGDQNIEIRECSTHENCSGIMYSCSIDDYIYILYLYIVYTFRLTFQTKKTSQEKEEAEKE